MALTMPPRAPGRRRRVVQSENQDEVGLSIVTSRRDAEQRGMSTIHLLFLACCSMYFEFSVAAQTVRTQFDALRSSIRNRVKRFILLARILRFFKDHWWQMCIVIVAVQCLVVLIEPHLLEKCWNLRNKRLLRQNQWWCYPTAFYAQFMQQRHICLIVLQMVGFIVAIIVANTQHRLAAIWNQAMSGTTNSAAQAADKHLPARRSGRLQSPRGTRP